MQQINNIFYSILYQTYVSFIFVQIHLLRLGEH